MIDIYAIPNIILHIPRKIKESYTKIRKVKRIEDKLDPFSLQYKKCKNTLIKKYLKYE